jgi:hypothetical protein
MPTADNAVKTDSPAVARRPGVWLEGGYSLTVREITRSVGISYWVAYRASRGGLFGKSTRVGTSLYFDVRVAANALVNLNLKNEAVS